MSEFSLKLIEGQNRGPESLLFLFQDGKVLVKLDEPGKAIFPVLGNLSLPAEHLEKAFHFGTLAGAPCLVLRNWGWRPPPTYEFMELRGLCSVMPRARAWVAGTAQHLLTWHQDTQFCGRCGKGNPVFNADSEKKCSGCGFSMHPVIAPAIIVAVLKGNELLLVQGHDYPSNLHSLVAGFLEVGENLEECLVREVYEETGLNVKNIRYFGSQPWPFPNSFMVGFIAEYAGGTINIDEKEIRSAGWFELGDLPKVPDEISIAGQIIRHLQRGRQKTL